MAGLFATYWKLRDGEVGIIRLFFERNWAYVGGLKGEDERIGGGDKPGEGSKLTLACLLKSRVLFIVK